MNLHDLVIQGIGVIGIIFYIVSFQFKSNRGLFTCQTFSYIFYSLHFLLLGAASGGANYLLSIARCAFLASKSEKLHSRAMCAILCIGTCIITAVTWEGWISLLPWGATIAITIGGYTFNPQKIRIAGMVFNSPLWIIYDIIVGSWAGLLDEITTEASIIISIYRYGWKNLDRTE